MATLKIKFRPSVQGGGLGTIYYQIIHNRIARQKKTGYQATTRIYLASLDTLAVDKANNLILRSL